MCNKEMIAIIKEVKKQDMSHFGELYEVFEKLIHHFEFKLNFDDAGQELTVFLLELLYATDTDKFKPDKSDGLQRYIAVSLRNRYILISKRQRRYITASNELYDDMGCYSIETEKNIDLKTAMELLSERQRDAIIYRHIFGYTDVEIAEIIGVSRQAVNGLQRRGIKILRTYFDI